MAYIMTAIMTGGVSALLSAFTGGSIGDVLWNYVVFGYMGMATLALAIAATTIAGRNDNS